MLPEFEPAGRAILGGTTPMQSSIDRSMNVTARSPLGPIFAVRSARHARGLLLFDNS
jgi:hypothetical protein